LIPSPRLPALKALGPLPGGGNSGGSGNTRYSGSARLIAIIRENVILIEPHGTCSDYTVTWQAPPSLVFLSFLQVSQSCRDCASPGEQAVQTIQLDTPGFSLTLITVTVRHTLACF